MYDAIIIGGGSAGLAAALPLGRMRRSTLVLDAGEPRNAPAAHMQNVLTRDGTPPGEFLRIARKEIARYATVEFRDEPGLDAVSEPEGGFAVTLPGNEVVRGRRLLLATGVVDELPEVEGLSALWGRGVYHCPYCHGYEVRGTPLAVLGSSSMAAHLALHLRGSLSDDVVLCTNGPAKLDPAMADALARQSITVRQEPVTRVDGRDGHVDRVVFTGGEAIERHALFVEAAMRQRSELPRRLGCRILDDDSVAIDELGRTTVPGVFAAGDMARRDGGGRMPAVIAAAASGTLAGAAIDRELVSEDAGLTGAAPVSARTA